MHQKTIILDLNFKHEEETKRHSNDWLRAKCKLRRISAFLLLYSVLVKSIFDCRVTNSEFLVLVNNGLTAPEEQQPRPDKKQNKKLAIGKPNNSYLIEMGLPQIPRTCFL